MDAIELAKRAYAAYWAAAKTPHLEWSSVPVSEQLCWVAAARAVAAVETNEKPDGRHEFNFAPAIAFSCPHCGNYLIAKQGNANLFHPRTPSVCPFAGKSFERPTITVKEIS